MDADQTAALQPKIVDVLKTVYDPEIPVDIYELGLIYEILVDAERQVLVKMTLTSPACPSAQQIPSEVRFKIKALPEVKEAWVEIVWEPPWSKERMSEAAEAHARILLRPIMSDLSDLYQEVILDHNRRPRNLRAARLGQSRREGAQPALR